MTCRTVFKIDVTRLNIESVYQVIDYIGVEPGITDSFLYFGMLQRDTEENNYSLYEQLNDTLSIIYSKKEILKKLPNMYNIYYQVDVKFSDLEEEINNNTSFIISDVSKNFMKELEAYYCLNNEYIDLD